MEEYSSTSTSPEFEVLKRGGWSLSSYFKCFFNGTSECDWTQKLSMMKHAGLCSEYQFVLLHFVVFFIDNTHEPQRLLLFKLLNVLSGFHKV